MRTWLPLLVLAVGCGQDVSGPDQAQDARVDGRLQGGADAAVSATPDAGGVAKPDAAVPGADAGPTGKPALKICTGHPFTGSPAGDFRHITSDVIALQSAEHAGFDTMTTGTGAVTATAKLQYGPFFKDLEDEDVRIYHHDCTAWKYDGTARTNSDGRISHTFPVLPYGIYDVRYEVVGDATTAPAQLWILPRETRIAVFDIDGTLTTSDFEVVKDFFSEIVSGDYVPEAYEGGVDLTHAVRDVGYVVVYMTGRPYWLTRATKKWLGELGFAPGPVFLAPTTTDALPTNAGVGDYKMGNLKAWTAATLREDWAHGNATTDIYAYLGAGIPAGKIWIIGAHAGEQGTVKVDLDWQDRAAEVDALPSIDQPFTW